MSSQVDPLGSETYGGQGAGGYPPGAAHRAPESAEVRHPVPSYVDPDSEPYRNADPKPGHESSGGFPVKPAGPPDDPNAATGIMPALPSGPSVSGGHPVKANGSGPHPISGGPSGPQKVTPGQAPGQQGGAYQPGTPTAAPRRTESATTPEATPNPFPYPAVPIRPGGRHASSATDDLASARLIKQQKRPPQSGWRRALFAATGGTINPGESEHDLRRRELISRVNQPLHGCYKIAMLSLKGGVGKTTATTTLGSTFASLRGDRVIAVDANPDRGTLSQKIPLETTATVRHLLRDSARVTRYSDVRAYTSQGPSRLEVLASEQDPAVSEAFGAEDYRRTITLLEHFYNIVLTDCGTGLMHSAMSGVLETADSLVIVSSSSVDGARSASATLDWLDAHGYGHLVKRSVAVINSVRPRSGKVDLDRLAQHFAARCRAVCRLPFDEHLEEGAEIDLDELAPQTRMALLELAATVADDFPQAGTPRPAPGPVR